MHTARKPVSSTRVRDESRGRSRVRRGRPRSKGDLITGRAVQWLRDLGCNHTARDETEALARSRDSNEGVYFVPALARPASSRTHTRAAQ